MLCCQYCGKALDSTSAVCDCQRQPKIEDSGALALPGNGGPAFPSRVKADPRLVKHLRDSAGVGMQEAADALGHHPGMSLRAWLAGKALAGILANPATRGGATEIAPLVAEAACAIADATLAELAKGGQ